MSKQELIIELVYKFRFLNRVQLQKILNHKGPRRINAWLKELVELKYLGRIYSKKLLENTKPAIYYLTSQGIKYIREKHDLELKDIKKFYEDKNASLKFIDHCINLVNLYIQFKDLEKKLGHDYNYLSKTELWLDEKLSEIKPDAYVEIVRKKKGTSKHFFDLFDDHVPRFALRYRIKQYIEFHDNYKWEEPNLFPYIMLIFPNAQKLKHVSKYIQKEFEHLFFLEDMAFYLTTHKQVVEKGVTGEIWTIVRDKVQE